MFVHVFRRPVNDPTRKGRVQSADSVAYRAEQRTMAPSVSGSAICSAKRPSLSREPTLAKLPVTASTKRFSRLSAPQSPNSHATLRGSRLRRVSDPRTIVVERCGSCWTAWMGPPFSPYLNFACTAPLHDSRALVKSANATAPLMTAYMAMGGAVGSDVPLPLHVLSGRSKLPVPEACGSLYRSSSPKP